MRVVDFEEKKIPWEEWRDKFLVAVQWNQWNDTQAKFQLASHLTGPIVHAQSALMKHSDATLQDVLTKIDAWYCPPGQNLAKESTFLSMHRGAGEPLVQYALRIETLAGKAFPGDSGNQVVDKMKVHTLMRGCTETARAEIYKAGEPRFEVALQLAKRQEGAEYIFRCLPSLECCRDGDRPTDN